MAITVTVNALDTVDTGLAIYRAELVLNVNLAGSAVIVDKAGHYSNIYSQNLDVNNCMFIF